MDKQQMIFYVVAIVLIYALLIDPFSKWTQQQGPVVGTLAWTAVALSILLTGYFFMRIKYGSRVPGIGELNLGGLYSSREKPAEGIATKKESRVDQIVQIIESYRPAKAFQKEESYQAVLKDRIEAKLGLEEGSIKMEYPAGGGKIDLFWPEENIGIEIKQNPQQAEIDRLYGQVDRYGYRNSMHVIIAIFKNTNREAVDNLVERLKRSGLSASVIVDGKVLYSK